MGVLQSAVLTFAMLSATAVAADFRAIDLGSSCDTIIGQENALGSMIDLGRTRQPHVFSFSAHVFNRDAKISYRCSNGVLLAGMYLLPAEELSRAIETLESTSTDLQLIYGPPTLYNTPWQQGPDAPFVSKDPRKYLVGWRDSRRYITASLLRDGDESSGLVRVVVNV